jgi:glutamine synthetase
MMKLAPAITAFGNTNPSSYFRLVPHQEAPTNVCWGDRNRSVLVRVPLGWTSNRDMSAEINPGSSAVEVDASQKQTVEIRSADGSADIYQLIAGLAVACRYGFELEDALDIAKRTYVSVNIHKAENADKLAQLEQLPVNCSESADCLNKVRDVFERHNVFSPRMIDGIISKLKGYDPQEMEKAKRDPEEMKQLVSRYFHCG